VKMKGFVLWSVFAIFYILIIILFQVSAQGTNPAKFDPLAEPDVTKNSPSPSGFNMSALLPSNLSLDKLGITDPDVRQTLTNMYGTLLGRPECIKKSICTMGNYFHDMPGRDIVFMMLSRYVPQEWGLLYDIFRVSVMYGQNCQVYICDPQSTAPQFPGPNPNPGSSPQNFENESDNSIHKMPNTNSNPKSFI
jgi:hypothetical protein